MESVIPTLYLYSRVSTEKQTVDGKYGLKRQQDSPDVIKTKERYSNLPVVELEDPGLSAYKGIHLSKGELGKLVKCIDDGEVAKGSIIAVEKIDRISRLNLTKAQSIISRILESGVRIYTWTDKEEYCEDDLPQAIKMLLLLEGAKEYSKNISLNVVGTALTKIKEFYEGKTDDNGNTIAINGLGSNAWWVDTTTGYVKKHDYYWPIAREIVGWILEGFGQQRIAEKLHESGYTPPRKKDKWGINLITRFHLNEAILGHKTIKLKGEIYNGAEYRLENYYPKIVTPEEYEQILEIKKRNRSGRNGKKSRVGLFVGFKKLRCGNCGRTINTFISKSKQVAETQRYKCAGKDDATIKCQTATVEGKIFETALIKLVGTIASLPTKKDTRAEALMLEHKIKKLDDDIVDIENRLFDAHPSIRDSIMKRLNGLAEDKLSFLSELNKLKTVPVTDPLTINNIPNNVIDYTQTEARMEWRENFYSHIQSITTKISNKYIDLDIELYNGNRIKAGILQNKYILFYDDSNFETFHNKKHESFGGVQANQASNNWFGIDRRKNIVQLTNLDDVFVSESREWLPHFIKMIERVNKGEDIFLEPQKSLPSLAITFKKFEKFYGFKE